MLVTVCLASFELWVFSAFSRMRTTLCSSQRGAGAGAAPCGQRRRETRVAVGQDPHPPGTSLWHPAGPGLISGVKRYPESWAGPWGWAQAGPGQDMSPQVGVREACGWARVWLTPHQASTEAKHLSSKATSETRRVPKRLLSQPRQLNPWGTEAIQNSCKILKDPSSIFHES